MYRSLATILVILFAAAGIAYAEEINPPLIDFTAGTPIFANEVNNNFDDVETAVDDNAADIDTLQSAMTIAEALINNNLTRAQIANDTNTTQGNTIADLQLAPAVFRATCAGGTGNCTNSDIEAAFTACTIAAPTGGCIIELLDETYADVRLQVPKLVREIRSAGDATILLGPTAISNVDVNSDGEQDDYIMLDIKPGAGFDQFDHGLWIHGFTVDGNKQNLVAPSNPNQFFEGFDNPGDVTDDQGHSGIKVSDQTTVRLQGLVIEDMVVKNFMNEGIRVDRSDRAVIRNNLVENLGCWENAGITGEPNGDTLSDDYTAWRPGDPNLNQLDAGEMGCGAWGVAQTTTSRSFGLSGYQPGVLSEGAGIEIGCYNGHTVVENNTVRYSTKLGIQTFCEATNEASPFFDITPEHVKIVNNDVSWIGSAAGILTLGSNFTIVDGNAVSNIVAPWLYGNTGKGIACSSLGRYNRFTDNTITNTAGIGLQASCGCGQFTGDVSPADGDPDGPFVCNAVASNNTIINPCSQNLTGLQCTAISLDTGLSGGDLPPANQSEGLTLHNNKVIRPGAYTTAGFADEGVYSDLSITGDIASGSSQIAQAGIGVFAANECGPPRLIPAPGVELTDVVEISYNSDPTGTPEFGSGAATTPTGFGPDATDGLAIYAYPKDISGNKFIAFKVCNMTSSPIIPGADVTINYRVTR